MLPQCIVIVFKQNFWRKVEFCLSKLFCFIKFLSFYDYCIKNTLRRNFTIKLNYQNRKTKTVGILINISWKHRGSLLYFLLKIIAIPPSTQISSFFCEVQETFLVHQRPFFRIDRLTFSYNVFDNIFLEQLIEPNTALPFSILHDLILII